MRSSSPAAERRRLRALRPPKPRVDPWRLLDATLEDERQPDGSTAPVLTTFLAGAECPFTCVFCDLWRFTTDAPTPPGAIPEQLRQALDAHRSALGALDTAPHLKLYNASNYFDPRAVPPEDDDAVATLAAPFARVIVECHPKLVGPRCFDFATRLGDPSRLQVAMGLETVHPEALARLNKQLELDDIERAITALGKGGIGTRFFVLLGAPWVPPEHSVDWTVRSVEWALDRGAEHVAVVPVRGGNGEMERLHASDAWAAPSLGQIEEAAARLSGAGPGVVTVDLWDVERFAPCAECRAARRERLERFNLDAHLEALVQCEVCARSRGS